MLINLAKRPGITFTCISLAASISLTTATASASTRDQAHRIFSRINSVPPSETKLQAIEALVAAGDMKGAAMAAIADEAGMFYNVTLKALFSRFTNTDRTPRVPLNDFMATAIGMVRDEVPFNQVLSADILYTGNVTGAPAYSLANNAHYEFIENQDAPLHQVLTRQQQTVVAGLPAEAVAGVMSTRAFAEAYYKAGTNRRALAFTLGNFLCNEIEQLTDTTRPDFRVRRDVPRAPGGDAALYRNKCAGCHSGMDALGGAFAHYDWDDTTTSLIYTPGTVRDKMNRNGQEFPDGFVTTDENWINLWIQGQNSSLGWQGAASGTGASELGATLADTDAFAVCMARRSFESMCLHSPSNQAEKDAVRQIADSLIANNFNMKHAFAEAVVSCTE